MSTSTSTSTSPKSRPAKSAKSRVHGLQRDAFVQTLDSVHPGISRTDVLEQTDCYVFKDGWVYTFNQDTCCRMPVQGLPEGFVGAVKADPLRNILGKIDDEEITVEAKEGVLVFKGKGMRYLANVENKISLPLDAVDTTGDWSPLHEDFADALKTAGQCTKEDDEDPRRTSVHICPDWIEACDDIQLCRWELKTGLDRSILVRNKAIRGAVHLGMTEFSVTESWIHLRNRVGLIMSCRYLDDGIYDDLEPFLSHKDGQTVTLPKGLTDVITRAEEVVEGDEDDNVLIRVRLADNKVRIIGEGPAGTYVEPVKVRYEGPEIEFMIDPQILKDLVENYSECTASESHLWVDAGRYKFVCCLESVSLEN